MHMQDLFSSSRNVHRRLMEEERVFNAADKGMMKKIYWGRGINDTPEMEEADRERMKRGAEPVSGA